MLKSILTNFCFQPPGLVTQTLSMTAYLTFHLALLNASPILPCPKGNSGFFFPNLFHSFSSIPCLWWWFRLMSDDRHQKAQTVLLPILLRVIMSTLLLSPGDLTFQTSFPLISFRSLPVLLRHLGFTGTSSHTLRRTHLPAVALKSRYKLTLTFVIMWVFSLT